MLQDNAGFLFFFFPHSFAYLSFRSLLFATLHSCQFGSDRVKMLFKRVSPTEGMGSGQKALVKEEIPWLTVLKCILSPLDIMEKLCFWRQRYLHASQKLILKA